MARSKDASLIGGSVDAFQHPHDSAHASPSLTNFDEDDSGNEEDKKHGRSANKRNRVHFACTECYRRKQKCNRETPCQHCIARKIPDRCKTFQPGEDNNDVASRLNRVERMLEEYLPRLMNQVDHLSSTSAAVLPSQRVKTISRVKQDPLLASFTSSPAQMQDEHRHRSGINIDGEEENEDYDELEDVEHEGRLSPKSGFYNSGSVDMRISSILDDLPGSSTKSQLLDPPIRILQGVPDLDAVMAEYGCPTAPTPDMLSALISQDHCNALLSHYFDKINWMRQPLPQKSLRVSFDNFWKSGAKITAQNINIFALLCNLCAIATLSVESPLFPQGPRDRLQVARRYHYAGRRGLLMSSVIGREDVDQIVAWITSCRFLLLDRRIGEAYTLCSSAVRSAFSIGLHRDGTKLGLTPSETEARRRVWASIYFMDRALALNTGRPAVIDDRVCDTQAPSNVMDEDVYPMPQKAPKMAEGIEPPTAFSYAVIRTRIAQLEGRILSSFQNLQHPFHVGDVLALDQSIRELQEGLPFYFKARLTADGIECNKSLDSTYGFLNVHRFLLHTEINSVRIALHRPYLLRSGGAHGGKLMHCREASLNAALHDLELRGDFIRDLKAGDAPLRLYRVQIGTYKWFHSLLVCGIVLLMDPWASNAPKLKSHLQHYVDLSLRRAPTDKDEMRDREAKVVALFLSRLEEVQKSGPLSQKSLKAPKRTRSMDVPSNDASRDQKAAKREGAPSKAKGPDEKSDAHLLLGLGQRQGEMASPRSTLSYSGLAGSVRPSTSSATTARARPPRTSGSGDWPRDLLSVQASPGPSNSDSPNNISTSFGRSGSGAQDAPITASPTPPVSASNTNNAGEDAQQIFDTWYQAEWASASMPSYDAAAYNGPQGFAGMFGGGMGAASGAAGASLGLDSLGNLSGFLGGNSTAGMNTGFNGTNDGTGVFSGLGTSSSSNASFADLMMNPTSQLQQRKPAPITTNVPPPKAAEWDASGMSQFNADTSLPVSALTQVQDGGAAANGASFNPNFDPAFWQTLIDKIVT